MNTLSATYCAVCASLSKAFDSFIDFFESVGRARAAAELSRQGYHEAARRLLLEEKES